MTYIEIDNLSFRYPEGALALDRLSLRVEPGELMVLAGPSGSGKTTLLRVLAGLEQPSAGAIRFDGVNVVRDSTRKRGVVFMGQQPALFPFLNVADNIAYGLRLRRTDPAAIEAEIQRVLELVGLPTSAARRPRELAGGEQQRVALARALVLRPRLLLLDEPLNSLDPPNRSALQGVLRALQHELALTTLHVTHNLSEAMALAQRIALLDRGTVVACLPPEQLYARPPTLLAARFVGISTFLSGQLEGQTFTTSYGPLIVAADGPPRATRFAIRPEHSALLHTPSSNSLPATLFESHRHDEHVEHIVRLGDEIVRVDAPVGEPFRAGQTVYLQLPREHLFEVIA